MEKYIIIGTVAAFVYYIIGLLHTYINNKLFRYKIYFEDYNFYEEVKEYLPSSLKIVLSVKSKEYFLRTAKKKTRYIIEDNGYC